MSERKDVPMFRTEGYGLSKDIRKAMQVRNTPNKWACLLMTGSTNDVSGSIKGDYLDALMAFGKSHYGYTTVIEGLSIRLSGGKQALAQAEQDVADGSAFVYFSGKHAREWDVPCSGMAEVTKGAYVMTIAPVNKRKEEDE